MLGSVLTPPFAASLQDDLTTWRVRRATAPSRRSIAGGTAIRWAFAGGTWLALRALNAIWGDACGGPPSLAR